MKRTFRNLSALLLVLVMLLSQSVTASAATVNIQKKDDFVFSPGSEYHAADLFGDDFKNLMPGDTVRQSITIKAEFGLFKEDSIKVSLKGIAHGTSNPLQYSESAEQRDGKDEAPDTGRDETVASMEDFLSRLDLKVTNRNNGQVIFDSSADEIMDQTTLGTFRNRGQIVLDVELYWNPNEDYDYNRYANRVGEIDWVFTVSAYDDPSNDNPKTGDYIMVAVAAMAVSAAALALLLIRKKRKT